tara:strand:- start:900 stop:1091 length:192 start_codon:yes stop_codon:yes gene_type:complete
MKFKLEIDIDNASFEDLGEGREISNVLHNIINKIEHISEFSLDDKGRARDMNGNTVAFWEITN